jgi:putative ABC transport system permease protein
MARIPAQWRKAPFALVYHRSVLVAVFLAALLAALASSSAPFVTTAAASEALKNRLAELTSFSTGVELLASRQLAGTESLAGLDAEARAAGVETATLRVGLGHVGAPVFTTQTQSGGFRSVSIAGRAGVTGVVLMARTGALAHVTMLSEVAGPGVWISDISAQAAGIRAGDIVRVGGLESFARPTEPRLRVKGIYRALAHEPQSDYWTNLFQEIYPQSLNANVPPSFVFLPPAQLSGLLAGSHAAITESVELPIDSRGLTLEAARALATRFVRLSSTFRLSPLGKALGCATPFEPVSCTVVSSLSAAVILANENASAVTPAVTLLSDLGAGIALAIAAAAGVFLVRRRRGEAALMYARGEHVAVFAARSALEALLPALLGGAAGFGLAYELTNSFAPAGSISAGTVWSGLAHALAIVTVGLCLLVAAAGVSFLGLYDTGSRSLGALRYVPWELLLAGGAVYLLLRIRSGGGISTSSSGAHAPTLAVFVYPLLLVAAVAGAAARVARLALRRGARGATRARPAVYLALRRLAAARGLVVVLAVVAAVSLGSLFYVETLAGSLDQTTLEKAYMATGSDASALVPSGQPIPGAFPYPVALVQFGNQAAQLDDGTSVDVMLVDPASLARTLHWQGDWGPDPTRFLAELARSPTRPLPVIVTSDLSGQRAIDVEGVRVPMRELAVVHAFPFMATGIPLVITSYKALNAFEARTRLFDSLGVLSTYALAKGSPAAAGRALASLDPAYPPQTIDTFLRDPEVVLATRTFGYMRLIAVASGLLALIGLVLYLQARQRSQAIASVLALRMGFGRAAQTLSLALEVFCLLAFAAVIGGVVAVAAAIPVVHRIDPLPVDPPSPIFVIPTATLVVVAVSLLLVALAAAAATSWLAARTDVSEALRVA